MTDRLDLADNLGDRSCFMLAAHLGVDSEVVGRPSGQLGFLRPWSFFQRPDQGHYECLSHEPFLGINLNISWSCVFGTPRHFTSVADFIDPWRVPFASLQ